MSVSIQRWYCSDQIRPLAQVCSPLRWSLGLPSMWLSGNQTHGIRTALVSPVFHHLYQWFGERTHGGFLCRAGKVTSEDLEPDDRLRGPWRILLESWVSCTSENQARLPNQAAFLQPLSGSLVVSAHALRALYFSWPPLHGLC